MRFMLTALVLFAVAVVLALVARVSHGNVVVLLPPYRVDVSINLAIAGLFALFLFLHLLIVGLTKVFDLPKRVAAHRAKRHAEVADDAMRNAFVALTEGRFGRAQRLAEESLANEKNNAMGGLIGARAAQRMREPSRRDDWLAKVPTEFEAAKLMSQAEFAIEDQDAQTALSAVQSLHARGSRHIQALRMSLRANEKAQRWEEVLRIVRVLERRDSVHPAVADKTRRTALSQLLGRSNLDKQAINKLRKEIPSSLVLDPLMAIHFFDAYKGIGDFASARELAQLAMDVQYCPNLALPYATLTSVEATQRLANLERWSKKYPNEPELAFALGSLCMEQSLWGKAKSLLEHVHAHRPSGKTHVALAQLAEKLEKPELAQKHYKDAAAFVK